jgi:hypothetical protein
MVDDWTFQIYIFCLKGLLEVWQGILLNFFNFLKIIFDINTSK